MEDWWNDPKKNSRAPGRTGSDRERPQPERPGLERHQKSDMDWWNNPSTKATGQVLRQIIKTDKELIKKAADTASQEVSVATQVTAREAEALAKVAQSLWKDARIDARATPQSPSAHSERSRVSRTSRDSSPGVSASEENSTEKKRKPRRSGNSMSTTLATLTSSECDAKTLCTVEKSILKGLARNGKNTTVLYIFKKLAAMCTEKEPEEGVRAEEARAHASNVRIRVLCLSHLLLLEMVESDLEQFRGGLVKGAGEPWSEVLDSPSWERQVNEYSKFLKMKVTLLLDIPELEGNYSLQRFEFRTRIEQRDRPRRKANSRRLDEIFSVATGDVVLRYADIALEVLSQVEHHKFRGELKGFCSALLCLEVNNLLLFAGQIMQRCKYDTGDLGERLVYADTFLYCPCKRSTRVDRRRELIGVVLLGSPVE
uniref:Uncharacterized protein n=2 Tax=Rhodosorus marinus TaxID=101924 RepID=A0A7S2ZQ40_9RHOD|mmetsp:Transcript_28006/g.110113  ORF Transcript_28006/g.110113 Transcript_28006/m.110113 type:complete len:428 (+) Transcript_28006:113-1396(+)